MIIKLTGKKVAQKFGMGKVKFSSWFFGVGLAVLLAWGFAKNSDALLISAFAWAMFWGGWSSKESLGQFTKTTAGIAGLVAGMVFLAYYESTIDEQEDEVINESFDLKAGAALRTFLVMIVPSVAGAWPAKGWNVPPREESN